MDSSSRDTYYATTMIEYIFWPESYLESTKVNWKVLARKESTHRNIHSGSIKSSSINTCTKVAYVN